MNMVVVVGLGTPQQMRVIGGKATRNQRMSKVLWHEDRGNAKHNPRGSYGNRLGEEKRTFQMENWLNKARKVLRSLGLRKLT